MKNLHITLATILYMGFFLISFNTLAQSKRSTITVLNIDTKGIQLDPQQMGNLVRIELEKLDTFDVTDRYDVAYLIEKNKLNIDNCYGKMCLLEIGNTIKSDYLLTGSVELYGQTIVTTFRLINVKEASIERTLVTDFLNLPLEAQSMVSIAIRSLFNKPNDKVLMMRLTKKFDYENAINNPDQTRLNLQGPRFGYTFIFGEQVKRLSDNKSEGGYEIYPALFQFGYQFEKQYLNEGNYQALFEFIPTISGVDQQLFLPTLTFLNGFRNNKYGWEIAIGPTIGFANYSDLAYINGRYYSEEELKKAGIKDYTLHKTLDSRGSTQLTSALIFAFGKTFKSGKMNIPVNMWASIPSRDGFRVGISVGYNSKK